MSRLLTGLLGGGDEAPACTCRRLLCFGGALLLFWCRPTATAQRQRLSTFDCATVVALAVANRGAHEARWQRRYRQVGHGSCPFFGQRLQS